MLKADPDYVLYQRVLELEPRVRMRPKCRTGELSVGEFLAQVFGLEQPPVGNTFCRYQHRLTHIKQKFTAVGTQEGDHA